MKVAFDYMNLQEDWDWVNDIQPIHMVDDTCGLVARDAETGGLLAACVMDNWTANSVQAHIIVQRFAPLRRGFLTTCADFMFNHVGCKYIYGQVPSDNYQALRLNKHMGFKEIMRLDDAIADGLGYVIMRLAAEECTVLPVKSEGAA